MGASAFLTAWCYRCRQYCDAGPSDIDTSGSPCQDWSAAGLRLGVDGKNIHLLLSWMRRHMLWQTAVVIHENVPNFDIGLLHHFMGHMYHIFAVTCGPEDVGFSFCRRRRLYVALVHKQKMRVVQNLEAIFWQVCTHLACQASVEDLLLAGAGEVQAEVYALASDRQMGLNVPGSMARAVDSSPSMARAVDVDLAGSLGSMARAVDRSMARAVDPFSVLTLGERERCRSYSSLWCERFGSHPTLHSGLIYNLGDNPDAGWVTWSAPSGQRQHFCIPTLRRGWTVLWLPALRRWLTIRERLAMMGFPSFPGLATLYRLGNTFSLPWHIAKQTMGNGMHVANVGVWQAVVAACVVQRHISS